MSKIKLSRWLEGNVPHHFPHRGELIEIIDIIAESTVPIRGLLERGIASRELQSRMDLEEPQEGGTNVYEEEQIHEDVLTHSIILKALKDGDIDFSFVASEESDPILGNGYFGITTDPVDGSSNVAVNRTVGTIVGIYNKEGQIVCSFYALYGIFTNLIIALNGKVAEFILDTVPYSMSFYHYVFKDEVIMPNKASGGIRCLGGDSTEWPEKCQAYRKLLIQKSFKDRYSGSFVGDFHAITYYGGVYAYFPSPKGKIRLYYEWLPLAFIARTLGGDFIVVGREQEKDIILMENIEPLTKTNIKQIHANTCGGLIGSKMAVDFFKTL